MSNNLQLPQVTAGQSQKEVTINEQVAVLDAAITEGLTLAGDGPFVLIEDEINQNIAFTVDGTQTADTSLTVPASTKKFFLVDNLLSGFILNVVKGATTVEVGPGATQILYSNGDIDDLHGFVQPVTSIVQTYSWYAEGTYNASETLATLPVTAAALLPAGLSSSVAYAETAPAADVSCDILKNGLIIGSVNFLTGVNAGTFTLAVQEPLIAGDVLTFIAPGAPNGLANVAVTLVTTEE